MDKINPFRFVFACALVLAISFVSIESIHADALVSIDTTGDTVTTDPVVEPLTPEEQARLKALLADLKERTEMLEAETGSANVTINTTVHGECSPVVAENDGVVNITGECGDKS